MGASLDCCAAAGAAPLRLPDAAAVLHGRLVRILNEMPYLARKVHPMHHWLDRCQRCLVAGRVGEAAAHLGRIQAAIEADKRSLADVFQKFDLDRSGALEVEEFSHFVTYVGFGPETAKEVLREADPDNEGVISFEAFGAFVGRVGGVAELFSQVREAVAKTGDSTTLGDFSTESMVRSLSTGSMVRSHFVDDGMKSASVQVAEVRGMQDDGHTVVLRFNRSNNDAEAVQDPEQVVPRDWVVQDLDLSAALCRIGIQEDDQHYWTVLLPPPESYAIMPLPPCSARALAGVRRQATESHNNAVGKLLQRCKGIGITGEQLWSVLTWVRDMAPVIIHLDLDAVGEFLEEDTHYRNQFETASSKGLLCPQMRQMWEHKLFEGSYDEAEPFERPKYGVLDVMNDNRGVLSAREYGDSYLVLKNSRLRCTFAPVDSGGIQGARLAVLDQYAHVLLEFTDEELQEVSRIANAEEGSTDRIGDTGKLQGLTNYKEAQIHGEVDLKKHVKRLVAHPRHLVDGYSEQRIRNLCDRHGWEFLWMHEEKKRRIFEERESRDSRMLEMSWASQDCIGLLEVEAATV